MEAEKETLMKLWISCTRGKFSFISYTPVFILARIFFFAEDEDEGVDDDDDDDDDGDDERNKSWLMAINLCLSASRKYLAFTLATCISEV